MGCTATGVWGGSPVFLRPGGVMQVAALLDWHGPAAAVTTERRRSRQEVLDER